MKKSAILYSYLIFVLLIGCIFVSCGGGGNNGTLPVTNTNSNIDSNPSSVNSTPTPVLTNVSVSGYIYASNITTEDGETVPSINILDVPGCQNDASGNESFIRQFSNSLQQDYPEEWARPEIQELYAQLNKTLSESKPLPECNGQVYSVYSDASIPVGSDGHFDNTVLTGATDSNVKLEVALGEDNYADVETLPSSGTINSSDATSAAVLKSCPEKIFAFPGEIVIFKVYSEPGINLKSAGLKFILNNPSIGCITQPTYLCVFGAHKYQVAYGCLYVKNGLNTPVDTIITAKTNSGQSLSIFLEVIKKTACISGTVYTGGMPLVKGFVRSIGTKACCKIDENGNYTLPKVFLGHYRELVCTYWTSENGQKVRHREEKIIDFFSSDVTGFNFGLPPTPTPPPTATSTPSVTPTLRPPEDPFYRNQVVKVINQYEQWENEFGNEEATQMTIDWLNGKSAPPLPEGVVYGAVDYVDGSAIGVGFVDGMYQAFDTSTHFENNANNKIPEKLPVIKNEIVIKESNKNKNYKENFSSNITDSEVTTFKPNKILILSAFDWELNVPNISLENLVQDLESKGYDVTARITHTSDINISENPCSTITVGWKP